MHVLKRFIDENDYSEVEFREGDLALIVRLDEDEDVDFDYECAFVIHGYSDGVERRHYFDAEDGDIDRIYSGMKNFLFANPKVEPDKFCKLLMELVSQKPDFCDFSGKKKIKEGEAGEKTVFRYWLLGTSHVLLLNENTGEAKILNRYNLLDSLLVRIKILGTFAHDSMFAIELLKEINRYCANIYELDDENQTVCEEHPSQEDSTSNIITQQKLDKFAAKLKALDDELKYSTRS